MTTPSAEHPPPEQEPPYPGRTADMDPWTRGGQWERAFWVNVHSCFWTIWAALKHLPQGGAIINTASINQ
jgi:NAD(P)-dependent dehydrogenase (short-subunit alcohol dehydrogenase family)